MAKVSELRDLGTDQLEQRVQELDDQVFRLRLQKSMGQSDAAHKMRGFAPRPRASEDALAGARAGGVPRRRRGIAGGRRRRRGAGIGRLMA